MKLELLRNEDDRIEGLHFDGHGCAISTASASIMTELLTGKTIAEAGEIIRLFISVLRGELGEAELEPYGDLAVFGGVVKFPIRVKCATLAWHALNELLGSDT